MLVLKYKDGGSYSELAICVTLIWWWVTTSFLPTHAPSLLGFEPWLQQDHGTHHVWVAGALRDRGWVFFLLTRYAQLLTHKLCPSTVC